MFGYYVQGNYHFMPEFLKKWRRATSRMLRHSPPLSDGSTVDTDTVTTESANGQPRQPAGA